MCLDAMNLNFSFSGTSPFYKRGLSKMHQQILESIPGFLDKTVSCYFLLFL